MSENDDQNKGPSTSGEGESPTPAAGEAQPHPAETSPSDNDGLPDVDIGIAATDIKVPKGTTEADVRKMLDDEDFKKELMQRLAISHIEALISVIEQIHELMSADPKKAQRVLRSAFYKLAEDYVERVTATVKDNPPDATAMSAMGVLKLYFKHFGDFAKALTELRDKKRLIEQKGISALIDEIIPLDKSPTGVMLPPASGSIH